MTNKNQRIKWTPLYAMQHKHDVIAVIIVSRNLLQDKLPDVACKRFNLAFNRYLCIYVRYGKPHNPTSRRAYTYIHIHCTLCIPLSYSSTLQALCPSHSVHRYFISIFVLTVMYGTCSYSFYTLSLFIWRWSRLLARTVTSVFLRAEKCSLLVYIHCIVPSYEFKTETLYNS